MWECEVHRVFEQRHAACVGKRRRLVELVQKREVDRPAAQARDDLLGLALRERQLNLGIRRAERGDRVRQQRRPGGWERGEAQLTAAQAGDRLERRLGGVEAREDALGVPDERLPGGGQRDAARMALEERDPGFALERRDLLRDGRLGVGQRLRGGRQRAAVRDLAKDLEATDIQHK